MPGLSRRLHYRSAFFACSQAQVSVKFGKYALELRRYILKLEVFLVKFRIAVFAEPEQAVEFAYPTLAFDDEADGVCSADRIVRNTRRKEEHLAFPDRHLDRFAVLLYLHFDVAFELVKKLLAFVPVIVFPRIRSADDHHDKIVVVINTLIPDRRLEQMAMVVDPFFEIERASDCHYLDVDQAKTYLETISNPFKSCGIDYSEQFY